MADDLISGNINFTGLASGTDFNALVDGLVAIEQRRVTSLENKRTSYEEELAGIRELNSALLTLDSAMNGMNSPEEFLVKNASSSNTDDITATAGPDALEASYTLEVTQLAKSHVITSEVGIATADSTSITTGAGPHTFSFDYNGETVDVTLGSGATLNDLVDAINSHANNESTTGTGIGVRATAFKIADGDYRLQLTALDTGSANTITNITSALDAPLAASEFDDPALIQNAEDARFELNGIELTRSTNSVDDAINDVDLLLKDAGGGPVTITVDTDTDAIKENVQSFVDAVNEVRKKILELTALETEDGTTAALYNDTTVKTVDQLLKDLTATKGTGFDYDDDVYSALSQVGVHTDAIAGSATEGLLVVDADALDEALENDPTAVAKIFSASYEGDSSSTAFSYVSCIEGTTEAGSYDVTFDHVSGTGTIGGYSATYDSVTQQLTGDAGTAVSGLVIRINDPSSSIASGSGDVRLKMGKAQELIDKIAELPDAKTFVGDLEAGLLAIAEYRTNTQIESLTETIFKEEDRIADYERTLKLRFARLEATLAEYNGMSESLNSMIAGMMNNSS